MRGGEGWPTKEAPSAIPSLKFPADIPDVLLLRMPPLKYGFGIIVF